MRLIDEVESINEYIDLDERAVLVKALNLFIEANKCYTNAYGMDKAQNSNGIVAARLLKKIIAK